MSLSAREIRAKAYAIADEIETRSLPYQRAGMSREEAMAKVIEEMAA